jgi:hypothetical protein
VKTTKLSVFYVLLDDRKILHHCPNGVREQSPLDTPAFVIVSKKGVSLNTAFSWQS